MSRLGDFAEKKAAMAIAKNSTYGAFGVENFMGGTSYTINPLDTLRIIAASSIFGEPQYYRDGLETPKNIDSLREYSIFGHLFEDDKSAVEIFESAIDEALAYDFKATLDLALELRTEYYMRLNPSVIFIRASQHENRVSFNELSPV